MSPRAQSRDDTPAANTGVRNGITAKRGVRVRGSRAAAGWPVRAAQPLRPSPATQHHGAAVRPSIAGEMRGNHPAASGSSSACQALLDDVGSAHRSPDALSPSPAQPPTVCSRQSHQASRSGSCRRQRRAFKLNREPRRIAAPLRAYAHARVLVANSSRLSSDSPSAVR